MNQVVKKTLLATVGAWDPLWVRWYRFRTGEQGAIPPFRNRDRIGARDIDWFIKSGRADHRTFRDALLRWADRPLPESAILDLGAGCGRILSHFLSEGSTMAAADVDPTAIRYLQGAFPAVQSAVNQSTPPLPFPATRFDAVYAFSVWTHLPIALQDAWLVECARVLRPDGLLLISTMGYHALRLLREGNNPLESDWHSVNDDDLRDSGAIYYEYPIFGQDDELFSGISASYGVAVHDPDYIRRAWSGAFDVLEIVEGAFREHQDLVVLRKKFTPSSPPADTIP